MNIAIIMIIPEKMAWFKNAYFGVTVGWESWLPQGDGIGFGGGWR